MRSPVNEAEADARARDEEAVVTGLIRDARETVRVLQQAAGAASGWLDDPRTSAPPFAGLRAQMLSACVAVGAVAIGREG